MKVELDPDVLKLLQEGHGGWNDLMFEVECTTNVRYQLIIICKVL